MRLLRHSKTVWPTGNSMTTQTNSIIQPDSWHNYAYLWQEGLHKKTKALSKCTVKNSLILYVGVIAKGN